VHSYIIFNIFSLLIAIFFTCKTSLAITSLQLNMPLPLRRAVDKHHSSKTSPPVKNAMFEEGKAFNHSQEFFLVAI
jgi:hypothetical protein